MRTMQIPFSQHCTCQNKSPLNRGDLFCKLSSAETQGWMQTPSELWQGCNEGLRSHLTDWEPGREWRWPQVSTVGSRGRRGATQSPNVKSTLFFSSVLPDREHFLPQQQQNLHGCISLGADPFTLVNDRVNYWHKIHKQLVKPSHKRKQKQCKMLSVHL